MVASLFGSSSESSPDDGGFDYYTRLFFHLNKYLKFSSWQAFEEFPYTRAKELEAYINFVRSDPNQSIDVSQEGTERIIAAIFGGSKK